MSLAPGSRLGPYEIGEPIGAGGMGQVYRARDTRLDRTVAIKVLPLSLAADPQFRERFDREARAISALEHPHICPLYDVGNAEGRDFLVMQFLDGENLADRIARGPLPLDEALRHAIAIADALDKAHSHGIVHRDLKPGNVVLAKTPRQGTTEARLLDFGLAKTQAVIGTKSSPGMTSPPTMTTPLTMERSIVGTIQYMAPEQLEGVEADTRSDIWAFGCVLSEMLTGERAFGGASQASLVGSILKDQAPRLDAALPHVPPALDHVVRRCLAKDPDERWQHIRDVRAQLAWIAEGRTTDAPPPPPPQRRATPLAWGAAGLVAGTLLALAIAWIMLRPAPATPAPVVRFQVPPVAGTTTRPVPSIAVSADGKRIVFAAGTPAGVNSLYLRALDAGDVTPIPGSDGALYPFFSPDGEWIGFFAGGKLKKLRVSGGGAIDVADAAEPRGGTWTLDDHLVFSPGAFGSLSVVSAEGGEAKTFSTLDTAHGEVSHRFPHALPDGRIVFSALTDDPNNPTIAIVGEDGGAHRRLLERALAPAYSRGHLFFTQPSGLTPLAESWTVGLPLMAVRLDGDAVEGPRLPVTGSIASFQPWATADYAVSPSGIVAWSPGVVIPQRQIVWVSASGEPAPLGLPPHRYTDPAISPDGRTLAVVVLDQRQTIQLFDLSRGVLDKLTDAITSASGPVWSPDGRAIIAGGVYQDKPGVFRIPIDQPGNVERLTRDPLPLRPTSWHGNIVAVEQLTMKARVDVLLLPIGSGGVPQPFAVSRDEESNARFSPDGKWITYESATEIYVRPVAGEGRSARVTPQGGDTPLWSADGLTIYYGRAAAIMAVPFSNGTLGEARQVAAMPPRGQLRGISPDGTRFLVMVDQSDATLGPITASFGLLDQLPTRRRAFR